MVHTNLLSQQLLSNSLLLENSLLPLLTQRTKRYTQRIGPHKNQITKWFLIKKTKPVQKREQPKFPNEHEIMEKIGLLKSQFTFIIKQMHFHLRKVRSGINRDVYFKLPPWRRVMLVLDALRNGLNTKYLSSIYGLSKSSILRELNYLLPRMAAVLPKPQWPNREDGKTFQLIGIVDGTMHPRRKIHPGWLLYNRTDKGTGMLVQLVTDLHGNCIYDWTIARGHNHDQALWLMSKKLKILKSEDFHLLADSGYSGPNIISPKSKLWMDSETSSVRTAVENVNNRIKQWKFAEEKAKVSPELQAVCLQVIYKLVAMTLKHNPVRQ